MSGMSEYAVVVESLKKSFVLPHEQHSGIKQYLINLTRSKKGYETQNVLRGLDFKIKKGEFFGIVGRNGSGKSTLLKLLAGIYTTDQGSITVDGTLIPFIELGVGFNPELTGRENIFLNGALLGFSRKQMEEKYEKIVEFSELERFMDQKLKNYSSGMQVRLAFSIAIQARGDVLLLDEVLAVGDEAFQRKCFEYFAQLKKMKKTVVLVTHDMGAVRRFCDRALLINQGKLEAIGSITTVTKRYEELNRPKDSQETSTVQSNKVSKTFADLKINLLNDAKKITKVLDGDSSLNFQIELNIKQDIPDAFFGFTIQKSTGEMIYWYTTENEDQSVGIFKKNHTARLTLKLDNIFGDGLYEVNLSVKSRDRSKEYYINDSAMSFTVTGRGKNGWMLHPKYTVSIEQ